VIIPTKSAKVLAVPMEVCQQIVQAESVVPQVAVLVDRRDHRQEVAMGHLLVAQVAAEAAGVVHLLDVWVVLPEVLEDHRGHLAASFRHLSCGKNV
jgi:hypothetical protein